MDEHGVRQSANIAISQVAKDGSTFVQFGEYDGSTGTVTLNQ